MVSYNVFFKLKNKNIIEKFNISFDLYLNKDKMDEETYNINMNSIKEGLLNGVKYKDKFLIDYGDKLEYLHIFPIQI
jgi:hypothetical protein